MVSIMSDDGVRNHSSHSIFTGSISLNPSESHGGPTHWPGNVGAQALDTNPPRPAHAISLLRPRECWATLSTGAVLWGAGEGAPE